jgi:hypothetical protein
MVDITNPNKSRQLQKLPIVEMLDFLLALYLSDHSLLTLIFRWLP